MAQLDRYNDLQQQGFMRDIAKRAAAAAKKAAAREVTDEQFRRNIDRDCKRRQQARWDAIATGDSLDDAA